MIACRTFQCRLKRTESFGTSSKSGSLSAYKQILGGHILVMTYQKRMMSYRVQSKQELVIYTL